MVGDNVVVGAIVSGVVSGVVVPRDVVVEEGRGKGEFN